MVGVAGLHGLGFRGVGPAAWCGVQRQGYGNICPPNFVETKKMAVAPAGRWGEE